MSQSISSVVLPPWFVPIALETNGLAVHPSLSPHRFCSRLLSAAPGEPELSRTENHLSAPLCSEGLLPHWLLRVPALEFMSLTPRNIELLLSIWLHAAYRSADRYGDKQMVAIVWL